MKIKIFAALMSLGAILTILSVVPADAADGTLKMAFKYKDPATGVEQKLNVGFIYLRDAAKGAPMEKYFSKPDYIFGPSNYLNGEYSYNVPAGKYFIRILQRKGPSGASRPYGPPEAGDLTWFQTSPITIVAGTTLDLGTKYASPFGSTIIITGNVNNTSGVPLVGRYVRATTEPCYEAGYDWGSNQCGPNKFMAQQVTDESGKYRLELRDPGTYYLSSIVVMDTNIGCSGYCAPAILGTGVTPHTVTVQVGDIKTVNIIGY